MNETQSPPPDQASLTSLVSGIIADAQRLIKQQTDLIRHEIREDIRKARDGAIFLGVGLGITLVGGLLFCLMPPYLLNWLTDNQLPLWACFGIVGLVFLILGACAVWVASKKFRSVAQLPESVEALKENVTWTLKPR
jgi:hypothetical protein